MYVVVFILGQGGHRVWWHLAGAEGDVGPAWPAGPARRVRRSRALFPKLGGRPAAVPGIAGSASRRRSGSGSSYNGGAAHRERQVLGRAQLYVREIFLGA